MARKIYFAFDYEDVKSFRANVVRNSHVMSKHNNFRDSSIWEEAKEKSSNKIKALIDSSLKGTSVTCVLIGSNTYNRRYVRYEIVKSFVENKGILGVGINWIKDKKGETKFWPGANPFEYLRFSISNDGTTTFFYELISGKWVKFQDLPYTKNLYFSEKYWGKTITLSTIYKKYSYDWDSGKKNFTDWVEVAAQNVGR